MSPILQRGKPGKSNRRWLHYLTLRRNKCFCFFLGLVVLIVNFKQNGIPIPDDARPPIAAAARAKELVDEQEIIAKEEQQLNDPKDARVTSSRAREISEIKKMAKEEQLNVIIFYPDDWRHDDLGGVSPILKTPFFTRLAKEGIRFTQNAVTTSICWISRATLFTGQYVSKHGSTKLFRPSFAQGNAWKNTWPYRLQEAGYFVGHIGKWQYHQKGYTLGKLFNFSSHLEDAGFWYNINNKKIHIIDRCKEEALRFLSERPDEKPFALTVAFYPPKGAVDPNQATNESRKFYEDKYIPEHPTYDALEQLPYFLQPNNTEARLRFIYRWDTPEKYQIGMKVYYSLISHIDSVCGQIVDELKRQGIHNKTMIIVSADNGEFHSAHALSDKWYPYQESIRVPLIIYDPRMPSNEKGVPNDSLTLNIDLAETILGAAGIKADDTIMQGRDIADLYLPDRPSTSKEPWRTEWYYEFPQINPGIAQSSALVRRDWKYIKWPGHDYEQLFNLKNDVFEMNDLRHTPKFVGILNEMRRQHDVLKIKVMAPNIPGTKCDPLWPPGIDMSKVPEC